jgi:hypothetical protein
MEDMGPPELRYDLLRKTAETPCGAQGTADQERAFWDRKPRGT